MTTEGKENIVSKIEKLMAMAKDSATTQNEKDIAERLLKKLADDYFINLEEVVNGIKSKQDWDNTIGKKLSFLVFTESCPAYDLIAKSVCHYCGVKIIFSSIPRPGSNIYPQYSYIFIGENAQCETADYFITYLIRSLRKVSAHKLMRKMKSQIEGGFAQEISARLYKLRTEQDKHIQSNIKVDALVRQRKDEIEKFTKIEFPRLSHARMGAVGDDKSGIGRSIARDISLAKAINGRNGNTRQLQ